jgi:dihydroorotate dehydrogenase electron transfer subunit
MLQVRVKILYNKKIQGNYFHLVLQASKITKESLPGQFLNIKVNPVRNTKAITGESKISNGVNDAYEPLLRRPFSIHRVKGVNVELLYEVVGRATELLSHRKPGEYLDVIGPLGNGFSVNGLTGKRVNGLAILVAGGMGVAPLVFLAEKIREIQNPKSKIQNLVLIGAKTKKEILCEKEFKKLGCEVKIATDDGSVGLKGNATELLDNILASRFRLHASGSKKHVACSLQRAAQIYACGPRPMLKEISRISKKYNIPAHVSLEEHMACGIGACLGCVVNTKEGFKRVCKEGPVFKADEIVW